MKRALAILSFLIPACVWGQVLPRPSETVHRKGTYRWTSEPEPAADKSTAYTIEELGWDGDARARFIQVKAAHPSGWCWLMCDEIIVR